MKKAILGLLVDAYRTMHALPTSQYSGDTLHQLKNEDMLYESIHNIPEHLKDSIGVATFKFAGTKFKVTIDSGRGVPAPCAYNIIKKYIT